MIIINYTLKIAMALFTLQKIKHAIFPVLLFVFSASEMHDGLFNGELSQMDLKILSVALFSAIIAIVMEYQDINKKNPKTVIVFLTPIISFTFVWLTYEYTAENGFGVGWTLFLSFFIGLKAFQIVRILFDKESNDIIKSRVLGFLGRVFGKTT